MHDAIARSWKLVIVLAALVGILAFVVPFHQHEFEGATIEVSAYRILRGYTEVAQIDPAFAATDAGKHAQLLASFNQAVCYEEVPDVAPGEPTTRPSRVPYFFLSVVGLLGVALVALWSRRLGWVGALGSVTAGLCAVGGYLREALIDREVVRQLGEQTSTMVLGGTLLLSVGLLAVLAGIGALVLPDPGGFRRPHRHRATLPTARLVP